MAEESNIYTTQAEAVLTNRQYGAVAPPTALLDEERVSRKKIGASGDEGYTHEYDDYQEEEVPTDPKLAKMHALKKRLVW